MEFKLFGASLVVVACSGFGFRMAASVRREIKLINELVDILNYMECELNYHLTPLPQLCRLSAKQGGSLGVLFRCFAEEMDAQISTDAASCMDAAICKCTSAFDPIEPLLKELGTSFGKFNLDGQLSGIDAVRQKCVCKLQSLEKDKEIRIRNYQTLGMCAGVALAILLF